MIKSFLNAIFILVIFSSCAGVKPVYFSADASVFTDTLDPFPTVYYRNVSGLTPGSQDLELFKGKVSTAFIRGPVFFRKGSDAFLVYPREHIFIKRDKDNYIFSPDDANKGRDNEFLVFKIFREREKWPSMSIMTDYTIQTVLDLEERRKIQIVRAEEASQMLFDSLCKAYKVSKKFKRLTKSYIPGRYGLGAFSVYSLYRDTLQARDLYRSKLKTLLSEVNSLRNISDFTPNVETSLYELYLALYPNGGIWGMQDEADFRERFANVENSFTGLARDYLLSKIMCTSYIKEIEIPSGYLKKYRGYSVNKDYRKTVRRVKRQQQRLRRNPKVLPNELLLPDGISKTTLEAVLDQHKGKYVFIDLWASWCQPCRIEMPYLEQLEKKYPKDRISFIRISTDRRGNDWRRSLYNMPGSSNNYLLLNAGQTAFYKQLELVTIPRYLLFDPEGNMIDADAPWPSDPALGRLIDSYLNSH